MSLVIGIQFSLPLCYLYSELWEAITCCKHMKLCQHMLECVDFFSNFKVFWLHFVCSLFCFCNDLMVALMLLVHEIAMENLLCERALILDRNE